MHKVGSSADMSDASMAEAEEAGDPMMQSPRKEDGATASGPNVAALRDALEAPVEFTDLKVRYLENTLCSIRTIPRRHSSDCIDGRRSSAIRIWAPHSHSQTPPGPCRSQSATG